MSKKNRKSLFTWCIRTLAVSLVPTMLMVSCAADDDDDSVVDTTAPSVVSTIPLLNASGVNKATTITVSFSEPIDTATVTTTDNNACAGSVQLSNDAFSSCVSFVNPYLVMDGNTKFIFDPANDLAYSGTYQLKLTGDIADAAGNKLSPLTIDFTVVDATMGETAALDLSANLTAAGISSSDAQAVVSAMNTQISTDNLSQSTDIGLITSSVIAGAFTGIGSIAEADRLTAVGATVKTVMQLLGKFSGSLTDATTGRSLSKTLAEVFAQIAADVSAAAASTNISDSSQVLNSAAKSQSENLKLAPVSDENAATILGEITADYGKEIATNLNISSA